MLSVDKNSLQYNVDEEKRIKEVARIRRDHGASEMDDLNNIINENEPPEGGEE